MQAVSFLEMTASYEMLYVSQSVRFGSESRFAFSFVFGYALFQTDFSNVPITEASWKPDRKLLLIHPEIKT